MKASFFNQSVDVATSIENWRQRPSKLINPQDPFFSLSEDRIHQMQRSASAWVDEREQALKSQQTVEQNYCINCMFIEIYKQACEYMDTKLAEEFTINLSMQLKPQLIKLLS